MFGIVVIVRRKSGGWWFIWRSHCGGVVVEGQSMVLGIVNW